MANGVDRIWASALAADGTRHPLAGEETSFLRPVGLDRERLIQNGIFGFDNLDPRAQSFVSLRWQLLNDFYRSGKRVLAITSTRPGEGKSFVAANLAAALCRVRPTVLCDLDLRRPTIGWRFGLSVAAGIDDCLAGNKAPSEIVQPVEGLNLSLAPVRATCPNSAEMLATAALADLLASLRSRADDPICIIDLPPVLIVDDILLIAQHLDGVMLVVEEGKTRRSELREALRMLHPIPFVGTVLNKSVFGGVRRNFDPSNYYR